MCEIWCTCFCELLSKNKKILPPRKGPIFLLAYHSSCIETKTANSRVHLEWGNTAMRIYLCICVGGVRRSSHPWRSAYGHQRVPRVQSLAREYRCPSVVRTAHTAAARGSTATVLPCQVPRAQSGRTQVSWWCWHSSMSLFKQHNTHDRDLCVIDKHNFY